jgi:hypothetical protein
MRTLPAGPLVRGNAERQSEPMNRRHQSCGPPGGSIVRRLLQLDQGERLAALTLVAVALFNVYEFINAG